MGVWGKGKHKRRARAGLPWSSLSSTFSQMSVSSVQSLSRIRLLATPWTAAHQASLSITNFQSLLKRMSIELVMPCSHLILCCPLLLLPSIFPTLPLRQTQRSPEGPRHLHEMQYLDAVSKTAE